jgi:hypothetical protein
LGGYAGYGINPGTGLWESGYGAYGDGLSPGSKAQGNFVVIGVPEPATIALLSLGGLLLRRRFSK